MKELFNGKKVLITGGLGFIGSNLAFALVRLGAEVEIIDNLSADCGGSLYNINGITDSIKYVHADISDSAQLTECILGKDVIFNLAGQLSHVGSMEDPLNDLNLNCKVQIQLLEECRLNNPNANIIFTSTRQIYGVPQYLPVDEKHSITPVDVNGIHKQAAEWYHLLYNRVYGLKTVVLRLTNIYGPRLRVKDARQTFLGIWIRSLIEGNPLKIFGTGQQVRDLIYIDDMVNALLLSASTKKAYGKIFNIGDSSHVSLIELAEAMINVFGSGSYELVPFPENRKSIDIGDYYTDNNLASNVLGWVPKCSLTQGLEHTLNFYSKHLENYI